MKFCSKDFSGKYWELMIFVQKVGKDNLVNIETNYDIPGCYSENVVYTVWYWEAQ